MDTLKDILTIVSLPLRYIIVPPVLWVAEQLHGELELEAVYVVLWVSAIYYGLLVIAAILLFARFFLGWR